MLRPSSSSARSRERDVSSVGKGEAHGRSDASRGQSRGRDTREREELASAIRVHTRSLSVQDAMKNLEAVCKDLKLAIKKLDKLARLVRVRCKSVHAACMCMGTVDTHG